MNRIVLALLLVAAALYSSVAGARDTYTDQVPAAGIPSLQLTFNGEAASVLSVDSSNATHGVTGKRCGAWKTTVNGQAVVVMLRVQQASNGLFVDAIVEESAAELDTEMGSLDLSSSVPAHPGAVEDAADSAVIAGAVANF